MRSSKIISIAILCAISCTVKAQISVSVNIGSPPLWGPIGYTEARYYYLPDVQSYYDVRSAMFIYFGNGHWISNASLPVRYRSYDLYTGYKVVMTDYHGETPYDNFYEHKKKYHRGYRGEPQRTIGERPEQENSRFRGDNRGEDKGKGHGERRGKYRKD